MELFHILARVTVLHANIEHHAHKRAERLMRERERNPLGLAETVVEYFARIGAARAESSTGEAGGGVGVADEGGRPLCGRIAPQARAPP